MIGTAREETRDSRVTRVTLLHVAATTGVVPRPPPRIPFPTVRGVKVMDMMVIGVVLLVLAAALLILGALAWSRKLPGNGIIGLRVPEVRKSREVWEASHRVAGPLWVVGGVSLALSGLVALTATGWMWAVVVVTALAALVLLGMGASAGARAAAILDIRAQAESDGCSSCSADGGCGCGGGSPAAAPEVDLDALRKAVDATEQK